MGTMTVTMDANGTKHAWAGLDANETKHLFKHFIGHAQMKVIDMLSNPDDPSFAGTNVVEFDVVTTRDSDGAKIGSQHNTWDGLSDAAAGAVVGAFDDAMAKLDKHLAAKKR